MSGETVNLALDRTLGEGQSPRLSSGQRHCEGTHIKTVSFAKGLHEALCGCTYAL